MGKENTWSVIDQPKFDPWSIESYFDAEGKLVSRDLYQTTIRLKRGRMGQFIENFREITAANQPYYFEFYSPAGLQMTTEVRGITLPEEQGLEYDEINLLVRLTPEQVFALFPTDEVEDFGY